MGAVDITAAECCGRVLSHTLKRGFIKEAPSYLWLDETQVRQRSGRYNVLTPSVLADLHAHLMEPVSA